MPDAAPIPEDLDAAHQRALAILLDVGTSITLELKTPSDKIPVTARAVAYKQVAEAVRRTIILSQHIAAATPARQTRETEQVLARKQVIRAVQDNIQREARPADADALRRELLERIDAPEFAHDLAHRSPGDLITELCRDLGLAAKLAGLRPALRRTPDDIAILCAQAAARPGSGIPQWIAAADPQAAANDAAASRDDHLEQRRHL